MCVKHNVKLTEDMVEKLVPGKVDDKADPAAREARIANLKKVAKLCKKQGQYNLACKKYTQVCCFLCMVELSMRCACDL